MSSTQSNGLPPHAIWYDLGMSCGEWILGLVGFFAILTVYGLVETTYTKATNKESSEPMGIVLFWVALLIVIGVAFLMGKILGTN